MLVMTREVMEDMSQMGKETYPYEGCGFLLGTHGTDGKKVVGEICRTENVNTIRARDRFEIDPKEFLRVEKYAGQKGQEVLGFFHSHPDHPPYPSQFDREMAWPLYSYLILSVRGGKEVSVRSWILDEESREFHEEEVLVSD